MTCCYCNIVPNTYALPSILWLERTLFEWYRYQNTNHDLAAVKCAQVNKLNILIFYSCHSSFSIVCWSLLFLWSKKELSQVSQWRRGGGSSDLQLLTHLHYGHHQWQLWANILLWGVSNLINRALFVATYVCSMCHVGLLFLTISSYTMYYEYI